MDFLKSEIARKKKLIEETNLLRENGNNGGNKYFKRGELIKKQVKKKIWIGDFFYNFATFKLENGKFFETVLGGKFKRR
jgi:hypothetical protein